MILFYIRKTLYVENAFHWNSVLRSLLLTSMWHFSVVRLFVKACRGGRKGGSFLQLHNITGICAFILWSTLLNSVQCVYSQGGETHHSASKQERSHIWTSKYQAQFSVKQRAKRIRVIFLCVPQMFIGSPLTNIGWILELLCCCFWPVEHL